jgi:serine protease AprX
VEALSIDARVHSLALPDDGKRRDKFKALLLETMAVPDHLYPATKGVGVAVIDSGFRPAAAGDFEGKGQLFDFTTGETSPDATPAHDGYGHGTHVAGLIASDGSGSEGVYPGLAPGVKLIHLKALDENGEGYTSWVVNAVNFAVANRERLGIDVINMSLGHPVYEPAASDPLVQAVERAASAGIVVVVSAGNNGGDPETHEVGYAGINSPGNAPSAITVGALDMNGTADRSDDTVPWYSSRGPTWYDAYQKPDLLAPGHRLISSIDRESTLYRTYPQFIAYAKNKETLKEAKYFRLSGTSMSSATVAAAAALIIAEGRQHFGVALPPNAVKAVLQYSALPLTDVDTLTQGAGALNLAGALELATRLDPTAASGQWWLRMGVSPVTSIDGVEQVWGQRIIWGDQIIEGDHIFFNSPAWAQRAIWGNRMIWGNTEPSDWVEARRIVWGNVSESALASLSADDDPFGADTLDETQARPHRRHQKRDKLKKIGAHEERSRDRRMRAGRDD